MNPDGKNEYSSELLQELMPKLGLDATEPGDNYKKQARVRYILPRLLIVCLAVVLIALAALWLLSPPRMEDMEVVESIDKTTVSFKVDQVLLLESVTASLDGAPVGVNWQSIGSYDVEADKNGELVITARTFTGRESQQRLTVSSIDEEPPHISSDELVDGDIHIYVTDGDGSGVNWQTLRAALADSGEAFSLGAVNEQEGYFSFPFPDQSVRIYVEDNNGNPLTMLLQLLPSTADERE